MVKALKGNIIKGFIGIALVIISLVSITPDVYAGGVRGYYRSNGTYVRPYYRSNPNYTVRDNYSYKGNINPYSGRIGTNYYRTNPTSGYYNPYRFNRNNSLLGY